MTRTSFKKLIKNKAAAINVCALMAAVLFNVFLFRVVVVHGPSMEDTLKNNHVVLLRVGNGAIQHGDIIVTNRENPYRTNLIKRVIAVEGQRVVISGGAVSVDGVLLHEPYAKGNGSGELDIIVPCGSVFLLGDNRDYSRDSRDIGCVDTADVMGRVLLFRNFTDLE